MADNKRLRILYIKDFFEQYTDEENGATMFDIMNYLKRYGIEAERRTIAEDIEALNLYGMDIQLDEKGKQRKLIERDFDLAEVRMLIDCVASSRSLTKEKSEQLIQKLQKFISRPQIRRLRWQVDVSDYQKSSDNVILYNIDAIYTALARQLNLEFKYYHYNMKKERELAEQEKTYNVKPQKMYYSEGYYYLYADDDRKTKTFRIDKMLDVQAVDDSSHNSSEALYSSYYSRLLSHSEKIDEKEEVKILFTKDMMDEVIDRFGKDISVEIVDEEHFRVKAKIVPDSSFFVWMFELGENAMIEYPLSVAAQMMDMLQERYKAYREGHSRNVYAYRKKNRGTQSSERDF